MGRAKSVDAFEIQPDMADMARRSVRLNGLEHIIRIHALPVESADEVLAPGSIDVIVCNPPYGHHGTTLPNPAQTLSLARHQQKSGLTAWFKMAYYLLRGKGRMAVIYPAARMLEVMKDMEKAGLAPKRFQLIYPSAQKAANLVMIEALKDARPMLHPEPPLMIYEPDGTLTAPLRKIYAMERASGVHAGDGEIQHAANVTHSRYGTSSHPARGFCCPKCTAMMKIRQNSRISQKKESPSAFRIKNSTGHIRLTANWAIYSPSSRKRSRPCARRTSHMQYAINA